MAPDASSKASTSAHGAGVRVARYESLDIWRGVACLLVIAIHSLAYVRAFAGSSTDPGWE